MERLVRGDVVAIPFPFSDLSTTKKRPALVLASLKYNDFILCQITSKLKNDNYGIELKEKDFQKGSLKKISFARANRLFTAHQSLIIRKVGTIKETKLKEAIATACRILESQI